MVRSIGARIAFWYALASLVTLGCFFRIGRYLVEIHVIHSLDLSIVAEFEQVKRHLGSDDQGLTADQVHDRLAPYSPVRFYIEVERPAGTILYRSRNLGARLLNGEALQGNLFKNAIDRVFRLTRFGREAASVPAQREYNAFVGELGEVRMGQFALADLTVRIAGPKDQVRSLVDAYEAAFYWLLALMLVVSGAIGYGLSRLLLRPLRLIQATAARISSDNLNERIPVGAAKDELSELAQLLNRTFERLDAAFQQTRRFTAEASHELKTPLSLVRLQAEKLMLEGGLTPAQEEAVQVQLEEIGRLNQIIEELLFLSRAEARVITLQTRTEDPAKFLEGFATDARVLAESRGMRFAEKFRGSGKTTFDPKWIRQVLLNLLSNALNVSPEGGEITLVSELEDGIWRVAVEDEGPGVPPEQRERIFERFVRLGERTEGSGLGLAISRSIIGLHRGTIRAEAAPIAHGLRVVFEIPAAG